MNNTKKIKIFKPLDFLVIFIILSLAVLSIFIMSSLRTSENLYAIIKQNGQVLHEYVLSDITDPIEIEVGDEIKLNIKIENSGATITHAGCDDKLCVGTGKLTAHGDVAVCVPSKTTVSIVSLNNTNNLDAITG